MVWLVWRVGVLNFIWISESKTVADITVGGASLGHRLRLVTVGTCVAATAVFKPQPFEQRRVVTLSTGISPGQTVTVAVADLHNIGNYKRECVRVDMTFMIG